MSIDEILGRRLYEGLLRCRYFDEVSLGLFNDGLTPGRMHSYIGEEAIAVGTVMAMEPGDLMVSTHRGGSHLVARGADMRMLYAEYMGRSTGYSGGKGGPMHISVPELGFLCTNGIVGSGIPIAVGAGMACQRNDKNRIVVCFFGDGAANTGSFHEGLNMAAVWDLPVVFICENNGYAETLPVEKGIAVNDIALRAAGYGIPGTTIDGNDTEAVYEEMTRVVNRVRSGEGPGFVEMKTYRIEQHFSGESNHYRTEEEVEEWREKDPVRRFERKLQESGFANPEDLERIRIETRNEAELAARTAKDDPFPKESAATTNVYTDIQPSRRTPI